MVTAINHNLPLAEKLAGGDVLTQLWRVRNVGEPSVSQPRQAVASDVDILISSQLFTPTQNYPAVI